MRLHQALHDRLGKVMQPVSFIRFMGDGEYYQDLDSRLCCKNCHFLGMRVFILPDSLFKIVLMHVQALMQPVRIVPNGQRTEDTLLSRK